MKQTMFLSFLYDKNGCILCRRKIILFEYEKYGKDVLI